MKIKTTLIDKLTYIYLSIPLLIFLSTWLNPFFAVISVISLLAILGLIFCQLPSGKLEIPGKVLATTIAVCSLWCILSGIGGYFYQNSDFHLRNALLRDLINFSFPVRYDNGSAMVYYMGFLMPAAVFGKLMLWLGAPNEIAFKLGDTFNLLFCICGVILTALQLFIYTKPKKYQFYILLFIFIFFSGLDILYPNVDKEYLEWHGLLQYSSNTTLLFWVYNQTLAPWLITTLFIKKPFNFKNHIFLAALTLFFAPMSFLGLGIYIFFLLCYEIIKFIKHNKTAIFLQKLFSPQNILSLLILLPILVLYYKSNNTVSEEGLRVFLFNINILIFFILEAGLFLFIIFYKNTKNPVYYITFLSLMLFPFLRIGTTPDLCMRASIPALFILMVLVIKFLFDKSANKTAKIILAVLLLIGICTPYSTFYRGFYVMLHPNIETPVKNDIVTLNNKIKRPCIYQLTNPNDITKIYTNFCNYGTLDADNTVFFKYFASKRKNNGG